MWHENRLDAPNIRRWLAVSDEGERDDRDDAAESDGQRESDDDATDESRGFHLRAGLQPISDMLGSFVEVTKTDAPPRSAETVEWEYVEEGEDDSDREVNAVGEDESDRDEDEDDFRSRSRERGIRRSNDSKRRRPTDADRSDRNDTETSGRDRKKRTRPIDSGKVRSRTHRDGDEFVVAADIFGISADDLSVGIDPKRDELVVGANDTALDRVALPWESAEAETVRFNNGVLEVRLREETE